MIYYQIFLFIYNYRFIFYTAVKTLYLKIFPISFINYFPCSLVFLKILCLYLFYGHWLFTILSFLPLYFLILYGWYTISCFSCFNNLLTIIVVWLQGILNMFKRKIHILFFVEFLLINCFTTPEICFFIFFLKLFLYLFFTYRYWGSQKNKILQQIVFLIYTFGSFFMLVGIILIFISQDLQIFS